MAWQITWSFTRSRSLGGCPRAHFLRYHAFNVRGLEDAPYLARLVSPEILAGDAVDYTARKLVLHLSRGQSIPGEDRVVEVGLNRFDERVANGPRHTYILMNGIEIIPGGDLSALHSQYYSYGLPVGRRVQDLREQAEARLRNLARCGIINRLASLPPSALQLPVEGKPKPVLLSGISVYAKPDLVIRDKETLTLLDWKAGRDGAQARCDVKRQLATYAAVEASKSGIGLEAIQAQAAFLSGVPDWNPGSIQNADVEQVTELAKNDLAEEERIRVKAGQCRQGGAEWRREFSAQVEERVCSRCPFLELCEEGRNAAAGRMRHQIAYAL